MLKIPRCFPRRLRRLPTTLLTCGLLCAGGLPTLVAQASAPFEWQYSTPEAQGVDSAQLARMLAQVQRERIAIHSFVLVRHDRIVTEAYVYPYAATTRHAMYSVSKSFTSALLGIAIDRGFISGEDARVVDVFQGVTAQSPSPQMNQMTLRHLLSMSTGHANDTMSRITGTADWARTFMELAVEEEPGSRFVYNSGASYMLAAAIQRHVGMTAAAFAREHLFGPLGITDYTWSTSPTNVIAGGWGLSLRPLDMARFGLLYLHKGQWEGRQIVSERWVDESSRRQISNGTSGFWNSGYGYQFWLNDFGGYRADGAFAQYIFILPEHDAVAVFTSNLADSELPARLMRQYVLPAMSPDEPRVANPRGNAVIRRAAETLEATPTSAVSAPSFTSLPADQTASAGGSATFSVAVSGTPAPSCQWYKDELPIPGANTLSFTLAPVRAEDAGAYVAVVRNSAGALASPPVSLFVSAAPVIVESPVALAVATGADAEFRVRAAGGELTYQWERDGLAIEGANGAVLRIANTEASHAGDYTVAVSNSLGRLVSAPARLTLGPADDGARLVNLSARAFAGTGDQTLIVGFVVDGADRSAGLPLLLRAVGPSLRALGVASAMADPATVLFIGGTPAATNSEWRGTPQLTELGTRVGAYPLSAVSADAAMHRVLPPRPYTMHVQSSLPDHSGIVLAECYDAAGVAATGGPRLVNLSARARVAAGDETLIGGFVIDGAGEQRVLIRGIGPTLTTQGVSGVLADPALQLFARGVPIAANDNWAGDPALQAAFASTGAFDLSVDSRDAALLVSLPAGVYSAHVIGANGSTGVALVEIYAVP